MNEHPEIQDFQERAAIMEYEAFPSEPAPDEEEALQRRAWVTLLAAKRVWNREFTLPELGKHLAQLRRGEAA